MYIIQSYTKKEKRKKGRKEGGKKGSKEASNQPPYKAGHSDMLHFVSQNAALVKARQVGVG